MAERIVAAYAAADRNLSEDTRAEDEWYEALSAHPLVDGLELSYTSSLHPQGSARLASLIDPRWSLVVTGIRRTLGAGYRYPAYGLASEDEAGRTAAVEDVAAMWREVSELERPVLAVEIHSAPNRGRAHSTADALERSLETVMSWEWGGTAVVLEHCDAFRESPHVQKGYLSLPEELEAVAEVSARLGAGLRMALNWGRSVLETESAAGASWHLELASRANALGGFFFSGVGATDSVYGESWRDVHLPSNAVEPSSLLTSEHIASCVRHLPRDLAYIGIKSTSHPERVGLERLGETFALLEEVHSHAEAAGLVRSERD